MTNGQGMSVVECILRLLAVALLAGYLSVKRRQRIAHRPLREDPARWTGTTIDVTELTPKVNRVRQDHLAARPSSGQSLSYRHHLLALAGRVVGQLSFFRDRKVADDTPDCTT